MTVIDEIYSRTEIRMRCLEAMAGHNGIHNMGTAPDPAYIVRVVDFLEAVVTDTVNREALDGDKPPPSKDD